MQRFFFARVEMWFVLVLALLGFIGLVLYGGVVLDEAKGGHRFGTSGKIAVALAEVPHTAGLLLKSDERMRTARQHASPESSGWEWAGGTPGTGQPGYYALTYFVPDLQQSVVDLVRLSDGAVMHTWRPDLGGLFQDARRDWKVTNGEDWDKATTVFYHPTITPDGGLVLKSELSPLVRTDACGRRLWLNDDHLYHHSTLPDGQGGFWVGALQDPASVKGVAPDFRDDAIAHIDADGKTLLHRSLIKVFLDHGLDHMVFSPSAYVNDPLHLNDIEPVLADGPYWKAGDLFVSLRHLNMVLLYRPATDELVWWKQGPWIGQHDVDILDDHRIAVYDNNVRKLGAGLAAVEGHSDTVIYDFAADTVTRPYADAFAREDIKSSFEGQQFLLSDGSFIVGDQVSGRAFFFDPTGRKLAQFTNRAADGHVYMTGWGLYVPQAEGDAIVESLAAADCSAP